MTAIGKVIRDAWVFGIIEETETCEGWAFSRIDALLDKVNKEWDRFGCQVTQLPPELFEKHQRVHGKAIDLARTVGWSGEVETDNDN